MPLLNLLRMFVVLSAACLLAACSTPVSLGNVFGDDDARPQTTPGSIAFEPVVGLPEALATTLAAELGTAAVGQRLLVVGREDPKAALRAKGYFTATTELSQTRIGYVWDLFDASGERKQRFEGQQVVGRIANDPWSVVDQQLLATIAQWTVSQIASSSDTRAAAPVGNASVLALNATTAATTPVTTGSTQRRAGTTFAIDEIRATAGDASTVLPVAMTNALAQNGAELVPVPAASHVVSGEASIAQSGGGMETVTLVWTLADDSGKRLGSIRQEKKVPSGALASTWKGHIEDAAKAAAPSLIALALPNR